MRKPSAVIDQKLHILSNERAASAPLSWAQQRLWFMNQLEPSSAAHNMVMAAKVSGPLAVESLRQALTGIVGRHEALRTVFKNVAGQPRQIVQAAEVFNLESVDLIRVRAVESESALRRCVESAAQKKFDLSSGPLIRGELLKLAADEHVLLITMHHIVSDGWSLGVFIEELSELYEAHQQQRADRLLPLQIQYTDYAQWQRQSLSEELLEQQLAYWRSHLEGAPPQLELPTDRRRPAVQSYRGGNIEVLLDARLVADLMTFAAERGMTLFMVLLAAWAMLLARLSGQDDVVIGSPTANRQIPELERLIGFFANTLALRLNVPLQAPLEQVLDEVKRITLASYENQDVPFERVVEVLQPARDLARHPVFQAMLVIQNAPTSDIKLSGATVTTLERGDELAMFDLLLSLEQRGDSLAGNVNYASDLFDRETIKRWMASFEILLKGMLERSHECVGDLPILPASERDQVLKGFNASQAWYPQERMVHELFEEQVSRTPDAVAAVYGEQRLSYAQLNRRANQLAWYLRDRAVGPQQLVGICVERSIEMVVGLLGILKAGSAYVPLDPNYPPERLEYMLRDAAPNVVLSQQRLRNVLPQNSAEVIELDTDWRRIGTKSEQNPDRLEASSGAHDRVYVIYTSGSTGHPKGTAMPHRAMVNLMQWHRDSFGRDGGRRVLQFAALSFDVAFQETFSTLCAGDTLVLLDEWVRRDVRALTELLKGQSIVRLFVPPLMLQNIAEYSLSHDVETASLQDVITAGEQLRITPDVAAFFGRRRGCRLHNHYGPTETHVVTALTLSGDVAQWPALPSIGKPISNTQIYVLDVRQQPVPIGVVGEIYIGGANVALGYLGREELTAQRFISDPFSAGGHARLYKTGDLGRWRADGSVEYLGRNDDQVKIRGYRIELGEIQARLEQHERVGDAVVVVREDVPGEKRLVAYITASEAGEVSAEELRSYLKGSLPEYMVPSAFVTLTVLPVTPSGKLDRRALPAPEAGAFATQQYEPPRGEAEQTLAAIWQELLRVQRVGRRDDFFELGGDSLLAMKLAVEIDRELGVSLPTQSIIENAAFTALARLVSNDVPRTDRQQSVGELTI